MPSDRLHQTLEELLTPEDRALAVRQADAEARGDATAALEAYAQGLRICGDIWPAQLDYIARAGDDAPDWLIARWVRQQAIRWMLLQEDPRIQDAVVEALVTHDFPVEITPEWLGGYGPRVAAGDLLCHELALHVGGGLADFLDVRAADELLARAGRVSEWPDQPLGVYEYLDVDRDVLTVRDLATGDCRRLLHLGAVTGVDRDARVLGRVVPVLASPGAMFEHRPIEVDHVTAGKLADGLGAGSMRAMLAILAEATGAGRMPWRPGTRLRTYLWSDALIVDERFEELATSEPELIESLEPGPLIGDLTNDGVPHEVAAGLATCQLALDFVDLLPEALPVAATHAATNLSVPSIVEAAREHLTASEYAHAWRTLADYVQEPLRSRCRELAAVAAARGARR